MQTLNIDEFCQVRVNSSNFGFTQTWENNTKVHVPNKRKTLLPCLSRSGLWMVWRWHGILCVYCYFCLEPTVRKDTWRMRTTSVTVMVIFFKIGILKVTWSQLCSKSPLNNYKAHWQQIRYSSIFYGHGSKCMLNLLSRLW